MNRRDVLSGLAAIPAGMLGVKEEVKVEKTEDKYKKFYLESMAERIEMEYKTQQLLRLCGFSNPWDIMSKILKSEMKSADINKYYEGYNGGYIKMVRPLSEMGFLDDAGTMLGYIRMGLQLHKDVFKAMGINEWWMR